jgi:benzoate/toluate 1,2-dioxygenase subunit alpha
MATHYESFDLAAYVRPNAVHHSVYVDADIFEAELTRIFERSWLYVGHESQAAKAGNY